MKTHSSWSYPRYLPPFFEGGEIYLCRIAPADEGAELSWLPLPGENTYTVFCRTRWGKETVCLDTVKAPFYTLSGLKSGEEYEVRIQCGEKKSRPRLFRTGTAFGHTVNYLHPDDGLYSFSGKFLCSPSLVRHPDGCLLASMDLFATNYPQNLTLIFRSDDEGKTWHHVSELFPCFWGKMFIHKGELYMLAVSTEYGDLLIGKSSDCGKTFTEPTVLLRGGNGKNGEAGVHKNPQPVLSFGGRLWNTLEWGSWGRGYHAPMVMSAPEEADLLCAESWSFSEPVRYDPSWPGVPAGPSTGNIEGCLAEKDGKLYNLMRYDMAKLERRYGLIVCYEVDTGHPEAPLTYRKCIEFPANYSKFVIRYDERTKKYYSLATRIPSEDRMFHRTMLSLLSSEDLENWKVERDIMDKRNEDPGKIGFQYTDFIIEGNEILFLCRTAVNGAASFHDANYSIFDRIRID